MPTQTTIFNIVSVTGTLFQASIVVRLFMSKLRHDLPLFFAYCTFSVFEGMAHFLIRNYFGYRSVEYFLSYWLFLIADTALAFFVIHEVYSRALSLYEGLRKLSAIIFRWAFMVLVLISAISALTSSSGDPDAVYSAILLLARCAMMVELGLLVLLFIFARFLDLGWRECIFGIAAGLCFFCAIEVVSLTLRVRFGEAFGDIYAYLRPLAWFATTFIWTVYVFRSEKARARLGPPRPELEEWNTAVLQFLSR